MAIWFFTNDQWFQIVHICFQFTDLMQRSKSGLIQLVVKQSQALIRESENASKNLQLLSGYVDKLIDHSVEIQGSYQFSINQLSQQLEELSTKNKESAGPVSTYMELDDILSQLEITKFPIETVEAFEALDELLKPDSEKKKDDAINAMVCF